MMLSIIGRLRQTHCICPLVLVGLLGNLILLILYFSSNGNELETDKIIDANGVPLFLHEPLENDQHRNSLKKQHKDMVRMKLYFRNDDNDDDDNNGEEDNEKISLRREIDLHPKTDNRRHLRAQQLYDANGKPPMKEKQKNPMHLGPDGLSDNAREVMNWNKNQLIPLKLLKMSTPKVPIASARPTDYGQLNGEHDAFGRNTNSTGVKFLDPGEERKAEIKGPLGIGPEDRVDPANIRPLVRPSPVCTGTWEVFLLVAVISDVRRVALREAIRNTWASDLSNQREKINIVFVIGKPPKGNKELSRKVIEETGKYDDILLLDMEDKYSSLTLKTLAMFHWVKGHCAQVKYILKADDDIFLNVPNLIKEVKVIRDTGPSTFMLGHVIDGAKPNMDRKNKFYMPVGQFKDKTYPTYLSGSAYLVPYSLLDPLLLESQTVDPFWLEDIYITGMLSSNIRASLIHNSKFEYKKRKLGPCRFNRLISAHEMSPDDLLFVWREMNRPDLKCNSVTGRKTILDYELHP